MERISFKDYTLPQCDSSRKYMEVAGKERRKKFDPLERNERFRINIIVSADVMMMMVMFLIVVGVE